MKYLYNGEEIPESRLMEFRPIEWLDDYQTIILRPVTNEEKIEMLDNWFKTQYREYNEMFTRRKELGIEDTIVDEFRNKTYHNLIELYKEAEVVASEIRELRS